MFFPIQFVNYRKQKLESVRQEMAAQGEKLREETNQREKLEDTVKDLKMIIQQRRLIEEELKSKLASTEEKLKKVEGRLEAALGEVALQQKISSTMAALMSAIRTAVKQVGFIYLQYELDYWQEQCLDVFLISKKSIMSCTLYIRLCYYALPYDQIVLTIILYRLLSLAAGSGGHLPSS